MASRTLLIVETPGSESGRFRQLARRAGFKVLTTNSGTMTSAVVRRIQPALVLVSPNTTAPVPSEIARGIKEDPTTSDVPVMILVRSERARATAYPTEACATLFESDEELLGTMRLLSASSRRLRYGQPKRLGPLEGHLDESFPDVLQYLFAARKTGRVTVQNGARRPGKIYIEDGNVVHAEHADRDGVEAFRRLCFATHGRFKFEPDVRTPHRTMLEGGIELLLESARAKDVQDRAHARSGRAARLRTYAEGNGSSFPSLTQYQPNKKRKSGGWFARITQVLGH